MKISLLKISLSMAALVLWTSVARAATFYLDAQSGSDASSGRSVAQAWRSLAKASAHTFEPGDALLLRAGQSWRGVLHPQGSGTLANPIRVGRYGVGAKPLIQAVPAQPGLELQGQNHWIMSDLAVQGGRETVRIGSNGINKPGVMRGITLRALDVADSQGGDAAILVYPSTCRMEDVLIENCTVRRCEAFTAIWFHDIQADNEAEYSNHVTVRGNLIDGTSDNGIIINQTENPLIEHNTLYRIGAYRHQKGPQATFAGIFPFKCHNGVIQHNEVAHTFGQAGGGDSQALDLDNGCTGTFYYQYNYTHDNGGGFFLNTADALKNEGDACIVRFNLSVNDGNVVSPREGGGLMRLQGPRTMFYNNTFINRRGPMYVQRWYSGDKGEATFANNVFVCPQGFFSAANFDLKAGNPGTFSWQHNLFFGSDGPAEDARKINADPGLRLPRAMTEGSGDGFASLRGFSLLPNSPCLNAGTAIANRGGRDFFGRTLQDERPDIGAIEGTS